MLCKLGKFDTDSSITPSKFMSAVRCSGQSLPTVHSINVYLPTPQSDVTLSIYARYRVYSASEGN